MTTNENQFRDEVLNTLPFALGLLEGDRQKLGVSEAFAMHTIMEIMMNYIDSFVEKQEAGNESN